MDKVNAIKSKKDYIYALAEYETLWDEKDKESRKRFKELEIMLQKFEKDTFPEDYKRELVEREKIIENVEYNLERKNEQCQVK